MKNRLEIKFVLSFLAVFDSNEYKSKYTKVSEKYNFGI
ncbi:hypothetical protein BHF72_2112 [Cloacibacterium normanense]|uniref:Uncharacterized protein n=1 Tax=Cloacibacterium normanense TaxID=237258 RepID=A0A1E5UE97_9FLAO|nr:hypothetical protein BHF72_2112 [Cloacibacterium normanense]